MVYRCECDQYDDPDSQCAASCRVNDMPKLTIRPDPVDNSKIKIRVKDPADGTITEKVSVEILTLQPFT